jgi:hypothetical protein
MSTLSTFALGLGGGAAVWYLTKNTHRAATSAPATSAPAPRNCAVHVESTGISVDGERAELSDAVRRCAAADSTAVTVARKAPASTYADLMTALRAAGVAPHVRAGVPTRNAALKTTDFFSLITYTQGIKDKPTIRYFQAEQPIAWSEARDRLAAAGLLDLALAGRTREPGGWMLSIDPNDFRAKRAERLPGGARNSALASKFTLVTYPEGVGGPKRVRWFYADSPILYSEALKRLDDAGLIDPAATRALQPGYWILVTAPAAFNESKAEPMPRAKRRRATRREATEGRRILRPSGTRQ